MNKRILKKFKKNNFIILFGITFLIMFVIVIVNDVTKKDAEEQQDIYEQAAGDIIEDGIIDSEEQSRETDTGLPDTSQNTVEETIGNSSQAKQSESTGDVENTQPVTEQSTEVYNDKNVKFTTADSSYLDGALFIGDSRTLTLANYANWTNTTFYADTGISIWKIMEKPIAKVNGKSMTITDALKIEKFDKIYIMLGVNELGTGTDDSFCNQYRNVINKIKELQPQAIIYIQSIMHVTQSKDEENSYINNTVINRRNDKIRQIADNRQVFWIDDNEAFDEPGTGKLNSEYTSDGVHLKSRYIPVWQNFLLTHVVQR